MIQALYFALCFVAIFLGGIIAIHVDFWIGLGIMILFTIKFMIQLPKPERTHEAFEIIKNGLENSNQTPKQ